MKINLKEHLSLTEKRNEKSDLLFSRKRNRRRCAAFRNTEKGLAFILPSFAGVCIFWLIPYVDVIRRSFCGAVNGEFVGIENYRTIFANKAFVWQQATHFGSSECVSPLLVDTFRFRS